MIRSNLHDYLRNKSTLALPGIGIFWYQEQIPSYLASDGVLNSPSSNVSFKPMKDSTENWDDFQNFIAENKQLDINEIQQSLEHERHLWKDTLKNGARINLGGLGSLHVDQHGDVLFQENTQIREELKLGLPMLKLEPIQRIPVIPEPQPIELDPHDETKEKTPLWLDLLIAFLIAILILIGYVEFNQRNRVIDPVNPKADFAHIDESRLNRDPVSFTKDSDQLQADTFIVDRPSVNGKTEFKSDSVSSEEESIRDCVIVVGSFKHQGRANRMIQYVENQKYSLHTEWFGDYLRVGYIVPCDAKMEALENARQEVVPDAWLLHIR